jgi:hypothetical protein
MKILPTVFFISVACVGFGQSNEMDYNLPVDQEDVLVALQMAGFSIYNFGVSMPDTSTYSLLFTIQEYIGKEMVSEKEWVSITTPYQGFVNNEKIQKKVNKIRVIIHKFDQDTSDLYFDAQIFGGKTTYRARTHLNDSFLYNFYPVSFNQWPVKLNSFHPLCLIGSSWIDSKGTERFCLEKELEPDYSSDAFNTMPAYYIIGYKLLAK